MPDLFSEPVSIKWEERASAPVGRFAHTAVMCNEVVYVGGGWSYCNGEVNGTSTLDIYYPDTNTWDTINTPHVYFVITVLTGKIIIVGGFTIRDGVTNKVLLLESGQWKTYTEMPTARCQVTAVSHLSTLLVMGGIDDSSNLCGTTELFNDTIGQWFRCDDLLQPLQSSQSVILGDTLYVLGGFTKDKKRSTAVYTAPLDTLSSHQLRWQHFVDTPCGNPASVGLNNKYLLAIDGNDIYTLNSTATTWMTIGTLPVYTTDATVVCDNRFQLVMIAGHRTNKVWIGSFQL